MSELDGTIYGPIEDLQFFECADLARHGDDDEQFERWLAEVSVSDFERLLDGLFADQRASREPASAKRRAR